MKFSFLILITFFSLGTLNAQIQINSSLTSNLRDTNFFFDASLFEGQANKSLGKLLGFPRVDLTQFTFDTSIAEDEVITSFFDGSLVYNSGTGDTGANPALHGQLISVTPGFYYFKNPDGYDNVSLSDGVWTRLGSERSPKIHITENTPTETNLVTVDATMEKVISITGTADGITTHMDLGTTVLPENTVVNFRKAIICDSTGKQVLVATGSYDTATNKFVTGNGMMNYCLPAATNYKVELYYTSN